MKSKSKLLTGFAAASMVITQAGQLNVFAKGAAMDSTKNHLVLENTNAKKTKKATIQWLAPTGLSGIEIYQKIGTGKYKKIYTAKGTSKKSVVSLAKVKKGKKVSYKIRYYKKSGNTKVYSMYSNVKTIKR